MHSKRISAILAGYILAFLFIAAPVAALAFSADAFSTGNPREDASLEKEGLSNVEVLEFQASDAGNRAFFRFNPTSGKFETSLNPVDISSATWKLLLGWTINDSGGLGPDTIVTDEHAAGRGVRVGVNVPSGYQALSTMTVRGATSFDGSGTLSNAGNDAACQSGSTSTVTKLSLPDSSEIKINEEVRIGDRITVNGTTATVCNVSTSSVIVEGDLSPFFEESFTVHPAIFRVETESGDEAFLIDSRGQIVTGPSGGGISSESDTLQSVTDRDNTTTNTLESGGLIVSPREDSYSDQVFVDSGSPDTVTNVTSASSRVAPGDIFILGGVERTVASVSGTTVTVGGNFAPDSYGSYRVRRETDLGDANVSIGEFLTVLQGGFFGGGISANSLQVRSGASEGDVLTSDANGNATWQTLPGGYTDSDVDARITNNWRGRANGVASLDGSGRVPTSQLPTIRITDVNVVDTLTQRNNISNPDEGDVAIVNSESRSYIWNGSAWELLQSPTDATLAGLSDTDVAGCSNGEVLKWNGSTWTCQPDDSGDSAIWTLDSGTNDISYSDGNVGIGTALNVDGSTSGALHNGFNESIQLNTPGHAAISFTNVDEEGSDNVGPLFFGMHQNGSFYWGRGERVDGSNEEGSRYLMKLTNSGVLSPGRLDTAGIDFSNTEQGDHTTSSGRLYFDENFYPNYDEFDGDGGGLSVYNEDGWGAVYTTANDQFATPNFEGLTVDNNVGIGTEAPATKLEVVGSSNITKQLGIGLGEGSKPAATLDVFGGVRIGAPTGEASPYLVFGPGASDSRSGATVCGTGTKYGDCPSDNTPGGSTDTAYSCATGDAGEYTDVATHWVRSSDGELIDSGNKEFSTLSCIEDTGSYKMRVNASGELEFANEDENKTMLLDQNGNLTLGGDSTQGTGALFANSINTTGGATFNGNVAISGTVDANSINTTSGATFNGNVAISGTVNANSFQYSSDRRLKDNIEPISYGLEEITRLAGVSYDWKDEEEGKDTQIGLIAQDVEKILPEVVSTDSEGMKSLDYGKLTTVLIEAIKDQQKEINTLKAKVESLR